MKPTPVFLALILPSNQRLLHYSAGFKPRSESTGGVGKGLDAVDKAQWQKKLPSDACKDAANADGKLRPNRWVDNFSVALLQQQRDARGAWGEWLASFRWQVYVVLTFASSRPSFTNAKGAVNEWLRELRCSYPRLTAYVSYDRGKEHGRLNVHVFLSGLFVHKPPPPGFHRALAITRAIAMARRAWTSGAVKKCERYDASRGAPTYLAQYSNSTDLIPEFFGERPIKKKKHRRRHHHHTQPH